MTLPPDMIGSPPSTGEAAMGHEDHATLDNRVLESFGRTAQHRCRLGLVERNLHARGLRVVMRSVVDEEAVVVHDRDRHAPAVLLRLRGRAGRDFLGQVDADLRAVGRPFLRHGAGGEQVNIKHSTNLLADIFSSLLWVLLTDQSDGNPTCGGYVWRRSPVKLRLRSCSMPKSGQENEDLRRRSRVQRRAALPLALQRSRAMEGFARLGWKSELIVCDNNSTDRTAEIAKGLGAQVVFRAGQTRSAARNTGAACAGGDDLFRGCILSSVELFLEAADAIRAGCLAGGDTVAYQDAASQRRARDRNLERP